MSEPEIIIIGPEFEVKDIRFHDLTNPVYGFSKDETWESQYDWNVRPIKTIKTTQQRTLIYSIDKYGLLNPLIVSLCTRDYHRIQEGEEVRHPKYWIIDGHRRYLAIRELIGDLIRDESKEFYIRCLVYPYSEVKDMMRHSIEDNRFSVKPSGHYLDLAERRF